MFDCGYVRYVVVRVVMCYVLVWFMSCWYALFDVHAFCYDVLRVLAFVMSCSVLLSGLLYCCVFCCVCRDVLLLVLLGVRVCFFFVCAVSLFVGVCCNPLIFDMRCCVYMMICVYGS